MVKLRLRRIGRKKAPFYEIVAIDERARRNGAPIERVGYIDPKTSPKNVKLDVERALYWLGTGAQPTTVVRSILSREGVLLRRALTFKGKDASEIEAAVAQHREKAQTRHERLAKARVARAERKAAAANAPAEEPTPAPAPEAAPEAPSAEEAPAAE
jgi:small subunit ribosomal protein S16